MNNVKVLGIVAGIVAAVFAALVIIASVAVFVTTTVMERHLKAQHHIEYRSVPVHLDK